jgi:hypothetical protein
MAPLSLSLLKQSSQCRKRITTNQDANADVVVTSTDTAGSQVSTLLATPPAGRSCRMLTVSAPTCSDTCNTSRRTQHGKYVMCEHQQTAVGDKSATRALPQTTGACGDPSRPPCQRDPTQLNEVLVSSVTHAPDLLRRV